MAAANGLDWTLTRPDANGSVRLERRGDLDNLDLGSLAQVRERLAEFRRSVEAGEMAEGDPKRDWDLDGPDTGGVVYLVWRGADATDFRLGHVEPVTEAFVQWLKQHAGPGAEA